MGIGIEYYAFILFVAAIICLIAILLRLLFANTRKQRKLLDEKESKLLQLYRTVESIMDNFAEQIKTSMDDIKEYESRAAKHMADLMKQRAEMEEKKQEKPPQPEKPAMAMTVDSSRIRAASEVLERAERMIKNSPVKKNSASAADGGGVIQRLFDDTVGEQPAAGQEKQAVSKRRESILALAQEGKTHAQIARELGITQNEVKLVIGLGFALRQNEK